MGLPNSNLTPVWTKVISTTYWAVQIDGLAYGSKSIEFKTQNAVLDTGTSLLGFPQTDFIELVNKVKGSKSVF